MFIVFKHWNIVNLRFDRVPPSNKTRWLHFSEQTQPLILGPETRYDHNRLFSLAYLAKGIAGASFASLRPINSLHIGSRQVTRFFFFSETSPRSRVEVCDPLPSLAILYLDDLMRNRRTTVNPDEVKGCTRDANKN